jgi:hypothetical protein
VEVKSNDPDKPSFQLKMKGKIEVAAAFDPPWITLGRVATGSTTTKSVKVTGTAAKTVNLTSVSTTDPRLEAKIVRENGETSVSVTFKADDQVRAFSGRVIAKTDLAKPAEIQATVSADVTQELYVDPRSVVMGAWDPKKPGTVEVRVASLSDKPFKIKGVKDDAGLVTGRAEKDEKGGWRITLTAAKDCEPGGKVKILTDRKEQPFVEVTYSATPPQNRRISRPLEGGALDRARKPNFQRIPPIKPISK